MKRFMLISAVCMLFFSTNNVGFDLILFCSNPHHVYKYWLTKELSQKYELKDLLLKNFVFTQSNGNITEGSLTEIDMIEIKWELRGLARKKRREETLQLYEKLNFEKNNRSHYEGIEPQVWYDSTYLEKIMNQENLQNK